MFWFYALGLTALCCLTLRWAWFGNNTGSTNDRKQLNIQLRKEQLQELELRRATGELDDDNFNQLKLELDKRLLDDTDSTENSTTTKTPKWLFLALATFIVVSSLASYHYLGAHREQQLNQAYQQLFSEERPDTAEALALFNDLHQFGLPPERSRLDWLIMSAQGYMAIQHYRKAALVYDDILSVAGDAPYLLANAAQAHYLANDRRMTSTASTYLQRALAINPRQQNALGFAGMLAFEQTDYSAAVRHWQPLVDALPPAERENNVLIGALAEAKRRAAANGDNGSDTNIVSQQNSATPNNTDAAKPVSVSAHVALAPGVTAPANATVFIFARAVTGPPMPLAVKRLRLSDLPTTVTLSDSDAMSPQFALSSVSDVTIKARISMSGNAISQPGDIESNSVTIALGSDKLSADLIISTLLP